MSKITFSEVGWEEYLYWQTQDKKTIKKINSLIKSIDRDGVLKGEGKPEKLKYSENEYSRRINDEDRLVYSIENDQIEIKSCKGHYDDK